MKNASHFSFSIRVMWCNYSETTCVSAFSFVLPWISLRGGAQVRAPTKHVNAQNLFITQVVEDPVYT